jgi:hypothetical protein
MSGLDTMARDEGSKGVMKIYILRPHNSVEPKKAQFLQSAEAPNHSQPYTPTSLAEVSSRGSQPDRSSPASRPSPTLFIGLDVHNDSVAVSPSDSTEVRRYGLIRGCHDDVLKTKRLSATHPQSTLLL